MANLVAARPAVAVVGIGPADADLVTPAALAALESAPVGSPVFFRTRRHPAAASLIATLRTVTQALDHLYDQAPTFEAVYESIVEVVLAEAKRTGRAVYAVPGSPLVAERTVRLLREKAAEGGIDLELVPGLSFCDIAWARLGVDPVAAGVRLLDGTDFAVAAAGDRGPLLVAQCWSASVMSDIKLAVEEPASGMRAIVLHHLGLPDEVVLEVGWADLDRSVVPDHLTSVFIPELVSPIGGELVMLTDAIATLRVQCPWDRVQTHSSLVRHLLEETYEAMEALEALGDVPSEAAPDQVHHAMEELGDLLCQVVFHANIARTEGLFDLSDVARTIREKLVRRHPHVFGDLQLDTAGDVVANWERIKQDEKGRTHLLDGIPQAMPALARTAAVERKLASVGLGYPDTGHAPVATRNSPAATEPGEELLGLARRLAHEGVDPEAALRGALAALSARVETVEAEATEAGRTVRDMPSDERIRAFEGKPVHY